MNYNYIIYFITLCKTYPNGYNARKDKTNTYKLNNKFHYNGYYIQLDLNLHINNTYIYQLKTIKINGKRSTLKELQKTLHTKFDNVPMSEIWY